MQKKLAEVVQFPTTSTSTRQTITRHEFLQALYEFLLKTRIVKDSADFLHYLSHNQDEIYCFIEKYTIE